MPASSTLTKVPAFGPRQSPTVLAHTTQPATRRAWASPSEPKARRCLLPPEYRTQSPACGVCFLPLVPPTSTRLRPPSATADASLWARVLRPAPSPPARRHRMSLRRILACPSPAPVGAPFRPPPAPKRRPVVRRTVTKKQPRPIFTSPPAPGERPTIIELNFNEYNADMQLQIS